MNTNKEFDSVFSLLLMYSQRNRHAAKPKTTKLNKLNINIKLLCADINMFKKKSTVCIKQHHTDNCAMVPVSKAAGINMGRLMQQLIIYT